jgi:hypothetical protein
LAMRHQSDLTIIQERPGLHVERHRLLRPLVLVVRFIKMFTIKQLQDQFFSSGTQLETS